MILILSTALVGWTYADFAEKPPAPAIRVEPTAARSDDWPPRELPPSIQPPAREWRKKDANGREFHKPTDDEMDDWLDERNRQIREGRIKQ